MYLERTFNVFVDNGLFVVANLLNKKIEDVTMADLKDNTGLFSERIYEFINSNKYKRIGGMSFHNSAFDQPKYKNNRMEKIKEQFNVIMNNVGEDEYCCICGKRHIKFDQSKDFLTKLNRAFIINCVADTFYNHSNNLQTINICPSCILLGMMSTLNMRKSGYIVLFNSEDNDFMYDLTKRRQKENLEDIFSNIKVKNDNTLELQKEILSLIVEKKENNNLKVYKINNGKGEFYTEEFLNTKYLQLFYEIYIEDLIHEFNETGLFYNMLKGNLNRVYLYKLIDFEKFKINCSAELLILLERGLNDLDKALNELIQNMCKKLSELGYKDCLIQLKSVLNYNKFVELILKWQETYKIQKKENLLQNQDEFDVITNRKNYYSIKNKIMFELILNK